MRGGLPQAARSTEAAAAAMIFCICTPIPRNENPISPRETIPLAWVARCFDRNRRGSADSVALALMVIATVTVAATVTVTVAASVPTAPTAPAISIAIGRRGSRGVKYEGNLGGRAGEPGLDGLSPLDISQRDAGRCLALVIRGRADWVYGEEPTERRRPQWLRAGCP